MNSITLHVFSKDLFESAADAPVGRYGTKTTPKETLSVVRIDTPADLQKKEAAWSSFQVVRHQDPLKNDPNVTHISDDLADVAQELNRCLPFVFSLTADGRPLASYAFKAQQFATEVNTLIQKRNDKIDASSWIAFLDVMLKILTFGLFHFKENLKAPLLNPLHWSNTCDPGHYKVDLDIKCTRSPIDHAVSISRFFETPLPTGIKTGSGEQERDFLEHVSREFQTPEANSAGQQRVMPNSRWSDKQVNQMIGAFFEKAKDGEAKSSSIYEAINEINTSFNFGIISSGVVTCHTHDGNEAVKIAIRKMGEGQHAFLTLDEKEVHYKVEGPCSLRHAIPNDLFLSINSLSFIPLGPCNITLPEKKPEQQ